MESMVAIANQSVPPQLVVFEQKLLQCSLQLLL